MPSRVGWHGQERSRVDDHCRGNSHIGDDERHDVFAGTRRCGRCKQQDTNQYNCPRSVLSHVISQERIRKPAPLPYRHQCRSERKDSEQNASQGHEQRSCKQIGNRKRLMTSQFKTAKTNDQECRRRQRAYWKTHWPINAACPTRIGLSPEWP